MLQWGSFLLQHYVPARLGVSLFIAGSLGFGIALLFIYFNKAIGVNTQGQQGSKIKLFITLIAFAAIGLIFYLLYQGSFPAGLLPIRSGSTWLPIISWTIAFGLIIIRSMKFNSALYHLLVILSGAGTVLFLSVASGPVNDITLEATLMFAAYYMLLVLSFNINSPVIRGAIMSICLAVTGFNAVFWLAPVLLVLWLNEPKRSFYSMIITLAIVIAGIYTLQYSGMKLVFLSYNAGILAPVSLQLGILMSSAMIILYLKIRKVMHYRIFLMASFKSCMALFLLFSCLPYPGLMLIDLFVSIAIFAETGKYHFAGNIKIKPFVSV